MFPRNYVVVVDEQNRLVDFCLYENDHDARRAYQSWHVVEGRHGWQPSRKERITYGRANFRIAIGYLPFKTLHSMSDDQMREEAGGKLHYEVISAAKDYELRSLINSDHRRSYYIKKYKYLLSTLIAIAVVSLIIFLIRSRYPVDPLPNLSLSISIAGFSVVAYFFHNEFGSWIGAFLAAVAAWVVWGIVAATLWKFYSGHFTPLFGW